MSELKPCPFCGGPVQLEQTIDGRKWWGVVCRNTINLGGTCAIQQRPSASEEAAIERWNRRAPAAEQQQQEPVADLRAGFEQFCREFCFGSADSTEWYWEIWQEAARFVSHQQPQAQGYTLAECEALFDSISRKRMKCTIGYDEEETCYAISEAELDRLEEILIGGPPEQPQAQGDTVPMPQNADQAQMMANLGIAWLEANAPERLKQPKAQGEPRKGWWCPTCNISPSGNEVTYQEFHQICGTYIGDAEPPSQPRAAVPDDVSELFYRWWFLQIENAEFFNRMQRYLNTEYFYKLAAAPAQPGDAQGGEG